MYIYTYKYSIMNFEDKLNETKKNFITLLEKHKTKESSDFDKYTKMTIHEIIKEFNEHKYLIENNIPMSIMMLCTDLGISLNTNPELYDQIKKYFDFFIYCSSVYYN